MSFGRDGGRDTRKVVGLLLVLGWAVTSGAALAQVRAGVEGQDVVIDAVTPGSTAAVVGVEYQKPPWRWRVVPMVEVVRDTDGDGKIKIPLPKGPGRAAVFMAVDLKTGSSAVATWKMHAAATSKLSTAWKARKSGGEPVLQLGCRSAVVLLVGTDGRLAYGVLDDGSDSDLDETSDGVITIGGEVLASLEGTDTSRAHVWHEGDRVIVVGLKPARFAMVDVPGGGAGNAGGVR